MKVEGGNHPAPRARTRSVIVLGIGALVHRSPHTVKDHLEKICAALEVHTRTEVVAAALRIGLI